MKKTKFCRECKIEISTWQWFWTAWHGEGLCKNDAKKEKIEAKKQRLEEKKVEGTWDNQY